MANWKNVAIELSMADGKIDDAEVKILKRALYADGKINDEEVKFLIELRDKANKKAKAKKDELNPRFEKLFFDALTSNVLKDGKIDKAETEWLKATVFADGKVDARERNFLLKLKKAAKTRAAEFDTFVDTVVAASVARKAESATKKAAAATAAAAAPKAAAAPTAAPKAAAAPAKKAAAPAKKKK